MTSYRCYNNRTVFFLLLRSGFPRIGFANRRTNTITTSKPVSAASRPPQSRRSHCELTMKTGPREAQTPPAHFKTPTTGHTGDYSTLLSFQIRESFISVATPQPRAVLTPVVFQSLLSSVTPSDVAVPPAWLRLCTKTAPGARIRPGPVIPCPSRPPPMGSFDPFDSIGFIRIRIQFGCIRSSVNPLLSTILRALSCCPTPARDVQYPLSNTRSRRPISTVQKPLATSNIRYPTPARDVQYTLSNTRSRRPISAVQHPLALPNIAVQYPLSSASCLLSTACRPPSTSVPRQPGRHQRKQRRAELSVPGISAPRAGAGPAPLRAQHSLSFSCSRCATCRAPNAAAGGGGSRRSRQPAARALFSSRAPWRNVPERGRTGTARRSWAAGRPTTQWPPPRRSVGTGWAMFWAAPGRRGVGTRGSGRTGSSTIDRPCRSDSDSRRRGNGAYIIQHDLDVLRFSFITILRN